MESTSFVSLVEKFWKENSGLEKWEIIILIAAHDNINDQCRQWCTRALEQGTNDIPEFMGMPRSFVCSFLFRGWARGNCVDRIRSVINRVAWTKNGNRDSLALDADDCQMILEECAAHNSLAACELFAARVIAQKIRVQWNDILGRATSGGHVDTWIAVRLWAIKACHVWTDERMNSALLSAAALGHSAICYAAIYHGARKIEKAVEFAKKNGHVQLADDLTCQ